MKKPYDTPECELIKFENIDVINTSNDLESEGDGSIKLPNVPW